MEVGMRSTSNRWYFCLAAIPLGMAVLDLVQWVNRPEHGFTEGQCQAISKGMTEGEVTGLLGCPAGNYSEKNYLLAPYSRYDRPPGFTRVWAGPRGLIEVMFDPRTKSATHIYYTPDGFSFPPRWYEPILSRLWQALEKLGY
jgi:hypothetical protein